MNLELKNKVVLLTGATGGIGKQICLDFLAEGAIVISLHRNEDKFNQLKNSIQSNLEKLNLHGYVCSLLNKAELKTVVGKIISEYKSVDVLVNCAGTVEEIPFAMTDEEVIDKMLNENLKMTMLVTQAVLKPMFSQQMGAIVNISSIAAGKGGRGIVAYAAAKSGIEGFSRSLAIEIGKKNIRINCVKPGAIQTNMSAPLQDRASEFVKQAVVLGRFGKPAEVSKAVLFLSSNECASYITGTTLTVDGGTLI